MHLDDIVTVLAFTLALAPAGSRRASLYNQGAFRGTFCSSPVAVSHQHDLDPHGGETVQQISRPPDGPLMAAVEQKMVMDSHNAACAVGSLGQLCFSPRQLRVTQSATVNGEGSGRIEAYHTEAFHTSYHSHIRRHRKKSLVPFHRAQKAHKDVIQRDIVVARNNEKWRGKSLKKIAGLEELTFLCPLRQVTRNDHQIWRQTVRLANHDLNQMQVQWGPKMQVREVEQLCSQTSRSA